MRLLCSVGACVLRTPDVSLFHYFTLCVCDVWIAITDEASNVFQHNHSDPLRNRTVLHGIVMKNVGDYDRLQQTDDHHSQTHRKINS